MTADRTPCPWWSDRWAWRGALALAPAGALAAILLALLVGRMPAAVALEWYVVGGAVAAGIGCLLGGTLGAVLETWRARRPVVDDEALLDDVGAGDGDADEVRVDDVTADDVTADDVAAYDVAAYDVAAYDEVDHDARVPVAALPPATTEHRTAA